MKNFRFDFFLSPEISPASKQNTFAWIFNTLGLLGSAIDAFILHLPVIIQFMSFISLGLGLVLNVKKFFEKPNQNAQKGS